MKAYIRRLYILLIAFGVVSVSLLIHFHLPQGTNNRTTDNNAAPSPTTDNVPVGLPVRLTIPAINVSAAIQYLGVTPNGIMDVPTNSTDAGWFKLGPRPGEKGSAVIDGHFDGPNGVPGVFTNLHKLKPGDKMTIEDDNGTKMTFIVRESRNYNPGYAEEVFSRNDTAHLNLITCYGSWDSTKNSYSKRLVVFADLSQ